MARRRYTHAEREEAVRLYVAHGPAAASRRLGIPVGTVKSLASRAGAVEARGEAGAAAVEAARLTWAERRAQVCADAGALAQESIAAMRVAVAAGQSRKAADLARAFAVAVDKAQLLDGGATSRSERLSDDEARRELKRAVEAAVKDDELAARRDARAPV